MNNQRSNLKNGFNNPNGTDLVEDDVLEVSDGVAPVVEHRPEDLGGHDQASGGRIDLDVAGHQTNVVETILEIKKHFSE